MSETMQIYAEGRKPYILVAPNGARRGPVDHVNLPVSMEHIVRTTQACFAAGAHGVHLHVRDETGRHSLDPGRYRETLAEIRHTVPGMDIQITTEAAGLYDVRAQLDCLEKVQPDWASISVREIARSPELADRVYALCDANGILVQHILYDAEDAALLDRWHRMGIVRRHQSDRLLVLGRYAAGQQSTPKDLDAFPDDPARWMICAFGAQEHACLVHAAGKGGDIRVGFENSLTDENGHEWTDNAASVAALVTRLKGH